LPTKNNPNETASLLIENFKQDMRYNPLGYIVGTRAVFYIVALSGRRDDEIATETQRFLMNCEGLGSKARPNFVQHAVPDLPSNRSYRFYNTLVLQQEHCGSFVDRLRLQERYA